MLAPKQEPCSFAWDCDFQFLRFFAIFSRQDAAMVPKNLMIMASSFCIVLAQVRREELTASVLTHWDEAAVYGLIYAALSVAFRGTMA